MDSQWNQERDEKVNRVENISKRIILMAWSVGDGRGAVGGWCQSGSDRMARCREGLRRCKNEKGTETIAPTNKEKSIQKLT